MGLDRVVDELVEGLGNNCSNKLSSSDVESSSILVTEGLSRADGGKSQKSKD